MSNVRQFGIGVVGAGMISTTYLEHLAQFPDVRLVAVGDLDPDRARAQADAFDVPVSGTAEDVLAHPDVDLVVNLTIPEVHAELSLAAVESGKHVWSEKPLAIELAAGQHLLAAAEARGVRVGVAPDTVLGRGVQSALRAIARGDIGEPLAASTSMMSMGPDKWHPNPDFLFAKGAGPVFDMGPYYFTTLIHLFGTVARATATGLRSTDTRTVVAGPRAGETFPVEVPTHVNAILEFESGAGSQSVFSWESALHEPGRIEVTGTEATLSIPDPNKFDGPLQIMRAPAAHGEAQEWQNLEREGVSGGRGLGVIDMVRAIRAGTLHRASGDLALHVLETMAAVEASITTHATVEVGSSVERPEPLSAEWDPFSL